MTKLIGMLTLMVIIAGCGHNHPELAKAYQQCIDNDGVPALLPYTNDGGQEYSTDFHCFHKK